MFFSFFSDYLKKEKILRSDLVKNLNFYEIYVPRLSERINDKDDLINEFINKIIEEKRIKKENICKGFISFIKNIKSFKNTLQLKNFLEWSLPVLCDINNNQITEESLVKLLLNLVGDANLVGDVNLLDQNLKNAREIFEKIFRV